MSFRENKIGHRSSENGAMHDIDFGDVLSTPAPVAASVATKKTHNFFLGVHAATEAATGAGVEYPSLKS